MLWSLGCRRSRWGGSIEERKRVETLNAKRVDCDAEAWVVRYCHLMMLGACDCFELIPFSYALHSPSKLQRVSIADFRFGELACEVQIRMHGAEKSLISMHLQT